MVSEIFAAAVNESLPSSGTRLLIQSHPGRHSAPISPPTTGLFRM